MHVVTRASVRIIHHCSSFDMLPSVQLVEAEVRLHAAAVNQLEFKGSGRSFAVAPGHSKCVKAQLIFAHSCLLRLMGNSNACIAIHGHAGYHLPFSTTA
jgi:hypothetical protein